MKAKYARACAVGLLAVVLALAGLLGATPAEAQSQCTYPFNNCPTTTTSPRRQPVIVLDLSVAAPGQEVHVTICGFAPGTVVKITLNGVVVATIVVGNDPPASCKGKGGVAMPGRGGGGGVVALIGPLGRLFGARATAQVQQPVSGGEGKFTVPSDLPQGRYLVCAQIVGGDSACANLDVAKAKGALLSSDNGNSTLAFTGAGLVRLLALALALVAAGGLFVSKYTVVRDAR